MMMNKKVNDNKDQINEDNKDFQRLQELVRKLDNILSTERDKDKKIESKVSWYVNPTLRSRLFNSNPECFVSIGHDKRRPAFLPICNRHATQDPEVIALSMKLIKHLNKMGKCDNKTKEITLARLKKLNTRLNKNAPNPYKYSAKKAKLTKYVNDLRNKIANIKNQ